MAITREILTLDTTYLFQFKSKDGSWSWYSQAEHDSEQSARECAESCYGGGLEYRVIEINRRVLDN